MFKRARKGFVSEPKLIKQWDKFVDAFALQNYSLINREYPVFTKYFGAGEISLRTALYGPHFYPFSAMHTRGVSLDQIYKEWNQLIWHGIMTFTPPEH